MFVPKLQEELKGKLKKKRHKSLQELGPLAPAQQDKVNRHCSSRSSCQQWSQLGNHASVRHGDYAA